MSIGQILKNADIVEKFKCGNMGGMHRSKTTDTLVIVSDYTKGIYHDKWIGGVLHYTGMGKNGDQDINWAQNATLAGCGHNGVDVHLFEVIDGQKELVGDLSGFSIVFKYVLPYENGRRPDVLLVSNEAVIILEFKRKPVVYVEDLDQAADYGRDIREYHFESRDKTVVPMLVLTRADNISYIDKDVRICSSDQLMENLNAAISSIGSITSCDIDKWIDSKYEPLPTMVEAARRFWNGEELPNIKQVHAGANLDEAIACLKSVTEQRIIMMKHWQQH